MDFNVKSWGWVGDICHKVESMIQEVDDIMKEKADPVEQNAEESNEDKKKFSFVEVQAALQRVKGIHSPSTTGKKAEEGEEACEQPVSGITVERDQSEEEHSETTSNCESTLNCDDEASQVVTVNSEITQSLKNDPKASDSESATQVAGYVSRDSSMSLGFPSDIGENDKPTVSGMARDMQDDELKDSGSSTPSLVNLTKEVSVESPGIHFCSTPSVKNDDKSSFKEVVPESSKCKDELYEMLLNIDVVDGNNIDEQEVVKNSLPTRPVHGHESHLHQEAGETFAPNASSVNSSLITITGKLMEQMEHEALTNDLFEKWIVGGSGLSHPPVSGTAGGGIDEPVPLANLSEEDVGGSQDSGTSGGYSDTNMETIDLDDEGEELEETCASVDTRDLFAVSERVKRFRSIKRKILDAFAARRRRAKEYEQLGILQGDVDFEHGGHAMKNIVQFLDNDNPGRIEHADDSDWELLG